jgi:hypothetical protein
VSQPQPVITIAVSDALARIEAKVDSINSQLISKAEAAAVHELETRVRVLETTQASQTAVGQALARARGAIWAAVSAVAAAGGLAAYVISQVHR